MDLDKFCAALLTAGVVVLATEADAAYTANAPVAPQVYNRAIGQFTSASSAGTFSNILVAGTLGGTVASTCEGGWIYNSDTVAHAVTFAIKNGGGTTFAQNQILVAANAGANGTVVPQAILSPSVWPGLPVDAQGNSELSLVNGDTLQAEFATSITSGDSIDIFIPCSDW